MKRMVIEFDVPIKDTVLVEESEDIESESESEEKSNGVVARSVAAERAKVKDGTVLL